VVLSQEFLIVIVGGKEVKDYLRVPVLAVGVKLGKNPERKK